MSKKIFATIGMIVCVVFVITGFVIMGLDNECSTASRSGMYDSGLSTFGADFYTYSNDNTAEAASAARTTANNIYKLYDLLADVFGWFFVFAGFIGFCHFGIIRAGCNDTTASAIPLARDEASPSDSVEELKKYKDLADSGAITQEEFETKKNQLLDLK